MPDGFRGQLLFPLLRHLCLVRWRALAFQLAIRFGLHRLCVVAKLREEGRHHQRGQLVEVNIADLWQDALVQQVAVGLDRGWFAVRFDVVFHPEVGQIADGEALGGLRASCLNVNDQLRECDLGGAALLMLRHGGRVGQRPTHPFPALVGRDQLTDAPTVGTSFFDVRHGHHLQVKMLWG